jgi:hypothetical protein
VVVIDRVALLVTAYVQPNLSGGGQPSRVYALADELAKVRWYIDPIKPGILKSLN